MPPQFNRLCTCRRRPLGGAIDAPISQPRCDGGGGFGPGASKKVNVSVMLSRGKSSPGAQIRSPIDSHRRRRRFEPDANRKLAHTLRVLQLQPDRFISSRQSRACGMIPFFPSSSFFLLLLVLLADNSATASTITTTTTTPLLRRLVVTAATKWG